jgi:hypothetical protein
VWLRAWAVRGRTHHDEQVFKQLLLREQFVFCSFTLEEIEIVEQRNHADEFDELALIVMRGDGVPYVIGNVTVALRERIGQAQRGRAI